MNRPTSGLHRFCILALFGLTFVQGGTSRGQDLSAPVVVAPVIEREVQTARRIVGSVAPLRTSTVGSAVEGRVQEYLVDHGDPVQQGQRLVKLRTDTLEIELAAAKAERSLAEQELAELRNGSLPEDIAEAEAKMLGARAAMTNAANRLKRIEALRNSNAISEDELGDARERAEAARQAYRAAEAALKRIQDGPRPEQIAQAEARLELQKEKVRLIEDRITKHTIVAPFDGFVAAEYTEVGAWIQQGDPVADVIQLTRVDVRTPVPAEEAIQLQPGQTIRVEFPELPGEVFVGNVQRIVPNADPRTRTFPVYIRLENRFDDGVPRLMAGMLARVELPTGSRRKLPLVPKDALVLNGRQQVVLVVDDGGAIGDEGVVREVPIELGVADGPLIQVEGDVRSGQSVVVFGNERLDEGDRVTIARVMEGEAEAVTAGSPPVEESAFGG